MANNFPCESCSDEVGDNDDSVQCDLCNKWNHTRCLNISAGTVQTVQWKYLFQHYLIKT